MTLTQLLSGTYILLSSQAPAIEIVLDFTLDEQNSNWFNPNQSEGLARRQALQSAADFLSTIIENDDWNTLPTLDEGVTFSDIRDSTIKDLSGATISGTPETDGAGYRFSVNTSNRTSVGANEYIVYVGAFYLDSETTALAIGGWDSSDRRNSAGISQTEFNTWGGRMWFNLEYDWYSGSDPGSDPTDDYGTQDPRLFPTSDISTDNWDWDNSSKIWNGFQLDTIDPSIRSSTHDLYSVALHELLHALGLTSSNFPAYIGVNASGEAIGENLVAEYGGPVPLSGGHFDFDTQSEIWGATGIFSETALDPNIISGRRKFLTKIDAAALRDLGYQVAVSTFDRSAGYNLTISTDGQNTQLRWNAKPGTEYTVFVTTDFQTWARYIVGQQNSWTDPLPFSTQRFYYVSDSRER